jgi:alkanesulfonate monooxygenase SsuD/methylene tetrahydromethanopterin reductase-like flavin-dependent oxidoreductase (luciferase family)
VTSADGIRFPDLGIGLWTLQSTALHPRQLAADYARLPQDAATVEALGFGSLWFAEHRFWYDGFCPAPLHAAAAVVSHTRRLRVGTAALLGPQHDLRALVDTATTLDRLSGGRVDLGLGLGHRDAEFDGLGLARRERGRRMERLLEELRASQAAGEWAASGHSRVWIAGMARAALERAARFGHGLLCPPGMDIPQLHAAVTHYRDAGGTAPVAMLRDVWVAEGDDDADRVRRALRRHYTEEAGAWWLLHGRPGFADPARLEGQLQRALDAAAIGPAALVTERLAALRAAGVGPLVLRVVFDFADRQAVGEQLERLAVDVAPDVPAAR